MIDILKSIITNILTAIYQPFWFSFLLSVLFMFVYQVIPILQDSSEAVDQLVQIRIIFPQDVFPRFLHNYDSLPYPAQPKYVGKSAV